MTDRTSADTAMATQHWLQECAQYDVSTWCDALDSLHLPINLLRGIELRSGQGIVAAEAVTAQHQCSSTVHAFAAHAFGVHHLVEATGPKKILVVAMEEQPISSLGGLAAYACVQRKAAGVLLDGACRDLTEIRATGLWLASRHVSPITGKGRLQLVSMGEPVQISGVSIAQGDLVVGDATGIVVVPRAHTQLVLQQARTIAYKDSQMKLCLKQGMGFTSACEASHYMPTSVAS
ncbi:RraA family protein [Lampropedia puyangensis]|uniref:Putative 4-hydroxy-4-methyl-2-oxoglutarate aldolase n=1 Tax=Lampropedia puyangensis TaxID=1330072 RepID=A0A4S8FD16_9BURK|nr:RraA family protein [Lampropedia puyangensis]THU05488.1 RraA family protein [Lampropedia puyangensis]